MDLLPERSETLTRIDVEAKNEDNEFTEVKSLQVLG
jgi:hypothetical protein